MINKPPRPPKVRLPERAPKKEKKETADKRRTHQRIEDEDEMERDYRLLKKLKKGTLSEIEFNEATSMPDEMEPGEPNSDNDKGNAKSNGHSGDHKSYKGTARNHAHSSSKFRGKPSCRGSKRPQSNQTK